MATGMGGSGSGNWYRWQGAKTIVEDSLSLSITNFRGWLLNGLAGTLTWTMPGGRPSSIRFTVAVEWDEPTVTLSYRWADREDIRLRVGTEITSPNFGGHRWWFTCPLAVKSAACRRRVGKLYLPPGAKYFGCRKCHGLTHRSSQEAHQAERVFGRLGLDPMSAKLLGSKLTRGR